MSTALLAWHGWGFGPAAFDPLRTALAGHCAMAAPTLLGPADGVLGTWADSLAASVAPDQVLLGWSLGAMLAMSACLRGARPRALVLISGSARFSATAQWPHALAAETVAAFQHGLAQNPARTLQRFLALQALGDARRAAVLTALEPAREHQAAALAPALDALVGADLRDQVGKIGLPCLIIHGAQDALMPLAGAQWLATQMPQATLKTLENCGHAPHVSAPAEVAKAITDFIASLPDA
ncbi:alpha/beta fold hydrolase [Niveibacterium sp. 24ML]|uniref:alpha/beta fold hydrolase n=1 Tax=Niveibacterium sp. 24ML TaxID=2985512 RepID=UPI00226F292D|nr:alpha/beta fold hydrolase [Niveibacterium sp. 24ML]MCX9155113.1 alpha/beta fold hydrolase [Niveibacterium sp. 24ML]